MKKRLKNLKMVIIFLAFTILLASCYYQYVEWTYSGHADETSESFTHWNDDNPPVIPTSCAKCHSSLGFFDFIGVDGTAEGTVDNPAAIGTVISCEVCHIYMNSGILRPLTSVTFPSGEKITGLGPEAICMQCHQGRGSSADIDNAIAHAGVEDDDTVSEDLDFKNIHYYASAATMYGEQAKGGYQYSGKTYDLKFAHVEGYDTCIACHNPHSLEVDFRTCKRCHAQVTDRYNLRSIRFYGSLVDYDGDGNISEGIYYEIQGLQGKLYRAIQVYATEVAGNPIVYDAQTYPYFFNDTNGNGIADTYELNYRNKYNAWTGRLLKAVYNYQVSVKDPGAFAHGAKYIIELLIDSIDDINGSLSLPINMIGTSRADEAHFDGSSKSFRDWTMAHYIDASCIDCHDRTCTKCHVADGLPYFLENGVNVASNISNGILCSTCHDLRDPGPKQSYCSTTIQKGKFKKYTKNPTNIISFSTRKAGAVTFPSGLTVDMGDDSNLCLNCHQGCKSKFIIDYTIAESGGPYTFDEKNIHYIAAGAVLYGTEVKGGYEYDGKIYEGQNTFAYHFGYFDTCVECHMGSNVPKSGESHNVQKVNPVNCVNCHGRDIAQPDPGINPDNFKFSGIRKGSVDFDGDGNTSESLKDEVKGLEEALYSQIQIYANSKGSPIVYFPYIYPFFFHDTDSDGEIDEDEANYFNMYGEFDPELLKAAYNYQFSIKEPHGYIHNVLYIVQLLVDSIDALGGDVSAYTFRQ